MFDINNFIVPLGSDIVLKIRNASNIVVHLIREATCTVSVKGNIVYIKQSAESKTIALQFTTTTEALDAHIILREALNQLRINLETVNTPFTLNLNHIEIIPTFTTVSGTDYTFNIPVAISQFVSLHVNGVLISDDQFTYTITPPTITWLGTADYILEPIDTITVYYV